MGIMVGDDRVAKDRLENGSPIPFQGSSKAFMKRLQLETWVSLRRFFAEKKFHAGGPIPVSHLFTQQNFNWVVSTPFGDGIDMCYELLGKCKICPPPGFDYEKIDWEVYFILSLLNETQRCRIPPHLQAGVMVLYFKICQGQKLPEIELDITHLIT
jgi:hypothetical protein